MAQCSGALAALIGPSFGSSIHVRRAHDHSPGIQHPLPDLQGAHTDPHIAVKINRRKEEKKKKHSLGLMQAGLHSGLCLLPL